MKVSFAQQMEELLHRALFLLVIVAIQFFRANPELQRKTSQPCAGMDRYHANATVQLHFLVALLQVPGWLHSQHY
jgi:uncharacterized protein YfaT (DUF1175 family)